MNGIRYMNAYQGLTGHTWLSDPTPEREPSKIPAPARLVYRIRIVPRVAAVGKWDATA